MGHKTVLEGQSDSMALGIIEKSWLCVAFWLLLVFSTACDYHMPWMRGEPMRPPEIVGSALGRPAEELQELDRRPLAFAFLEGRYATFVVRDRRTGEILEVTMDLDSGRRVDLSELRQLDQERAQVRGRKLEPDLLRILLRHPDLEQVQVRIHFSLAPLAPAEGEADWGDVSVRQQFKSLLDAELRDLEIDMSLPIPTESPAVEATLGAPQIVRLGESLLVQRIGLIGEPEIMDDDSD
jgi:hypothetical protein